MPRAAKQPPQTRCGATLPAVRVGAEPFANRYVASVKIDIAQDVRNAVARANAGIEIDGRLRLSAALEQSEAGRRRSMPVGCPGASVRRVNEQ